jgi:hypothetical protein
MPGILHGRRAFSHTITSSDQDSHATHAVMKLASVPATMAWRPKRLRCGGASEGTHGLRRTRPLFLSAAAYSAGLPRAAGGTERPTTPARATMVST